MSVDIPDAASTSAPAPVDVARTKKRLALRVVLVVLTLALWKGWAEENHFLDLKISQENQVLQSSSNNSGFASTFPSFDQHVVQVDERENHYRERQSAQPFKIVLMILWTAFAGWLAIAPKAKEKLDIALDALNTAPKNVMALTTGVACAIGAFVPWIICGHAFTGGFWAFVIAVYMYWLGRQQQA